MPTRLPPLAPTPVRSATVLFIACLSRCSAQVMLNDVEIDKFSYNGWEGAYRLHNSKAELVVVPALGGRVMSYRLLDSQNLLWEDEAEAGKLYEHHQTPEAKWHNYGGYKVWPAPQDQAQKAGWRLAHDNYPCEVRVLDDAEIRLIGAPLKWTGTQFSVDLKLYPHTSRVRVRQRIRNVTDKPVRWSAWDVTQLSPHCVITFPRNPDSRFPNGVRFWNEAHVDLPQWQVGPRLVTVNRPSAQGKIGADSEAGWISYRRGDLVYVKSFGYDPTAEYPDEGCSVEVYTCPRYVEVEVLSPLYNLAPGEERVFTEEWTLQRMTSERPPPPPAVSGSIAGPPV